MKIIILYRPQSEFSRGVETFAHDFQSRHLDMADNLELIDYDSRDGSRTAQLYDVMSHPTILILRDDGSLVKDWRQDSLPPIDEVANFAYSVR